MTIVAVRYHRVDVHGQRLRKPEARFTPVQHGRQPFLEHGGDDVQAAARRRLPRRPGS
jgi:hypothetical protein